MARPKKIRPTEQVAEIADSEVVESFIEFTTEVVQYSPVAVQLAEHFGVKIESEVNGFLTLTNGNKSLGINIVGGFEAARRGIQSSRVF